MAGVDGVAELGREMRASLGNAVDLCMAREDWWKGYFQLLVSQESSRYLFAAAWDPKQGVRIFKPQRITFGPADAPPQFCRVDTAVLQIVAHYFIVPAVPHVDDDIIIETVDAMASARRALILVHEKLGFRLSPGKAVPSRLAADGSAIRLEDLGTGVPRGVALGVEWDWAVSARDKQLGILARVRLPVCKSIKYQIRYRRVEICGRMSSGEARKLASTTDYAASATLCKCARVFTKILRDWEQSPRLGRRTLTPTAQLALPILRAFLGDNSWHKVLTKSTSRPFAVIFSDARGRYLEAGEWRAERLAAVLITATGGRYTTLDTSDRDATAWISGMGSEYRINECESLAALLGLHTFAPFLHDAEVVHFVDSTAAEGTLTKAYSRSATLAATAGVYWTTAGRFSIAAWIGRVPSRLNVADGPTRSDYSDMEAWGWQHTPPSLPAAHPWQVLLQNSL